jgi:hypothetical protein
VRARWRDDKPTTPNPPRLSRRRQCMGSPRDSLRVCAPRGIRAQSRGSVAGLSPRGMHARTPGPEQRSAQARAPARCPPERESDPRGHRVAERSGRRHRNLVAGILQRLGERHERPEMPVLRNRCQQRPHARQTYSHARGQRGGGPDPRLPPVAPAVATPQRSPDGRTPLHHREAGATGAQDAMRYFGADSAAARSKNRAPRKDRRIVRQR